MSEANVNPNDVIEIAIDDGYNNTKVVMSDGTTFVTPSRAKVGANDEVQLSSSGESSTAEYAAFDESDPDQKHGISYVVGSSIEYPESTQFPGYPTSALNRVIVQHALQAAGLGGKTVNLTTGLPVRSYYRRGSDSQKNERLIEAKKNSLRLTVTPKKGVATNIAEQTVVPEGFAAWFDWLISDENGEVVINEAREKMYMAIIDIGGRTTDYAVVKNASVQLAKSGSIDAGMLDVRNAVRQMLMNDERLDLDEVPSEVAIDRVMENGSIRRFNKDIDVSEYVVKAKEQVMAKIKNATLERIGNGGELEHVLLIGGGIEALKDHVTDWFPHQTVAKDALFANARGMLKYARYCK